MTMCVPQCASERSTGFGPKAARRCAVRAWYLHRGSCVARHVVRGMGSERSTGSGPKAARPFTLAPVRTRHSRGYQAVCNASASRSGCFITTPLRRCPVRLLTLAFAVRHHSVVNIGGTLSASRLRPTRRAVRELSVGVGAPSWCAFGGAFNWVRPEGRSPMST